MQIPKKTWDKYIKQLSSLNYAAGTLIKDYVETNGIEDKKALTNYAYAIVQKYGNGSAALSAAMYDTLAALEGANVAPAVMADLPEYDEVAKTVYGTLKSSKNPDELASATSRLVKRAGADTTLKNAKRDGAQFAWVPAGDTCAFCLALASNGWQYMSKEAMKGGHAEHIHANCDCTYAVRFDNSTTVAGYDPQKYKDIYDDAEGKSSKDKVNAIRRMQYNENKDKINAQKREAYALRKETLQKDKLEKEFLTLGKQGNTYVAKTEKLYEYSQKIEPIDGFEDIVSHGDATSIVFKDSNGIETNVSAEEFADILEKGGVYQGGRIRLIVCEAGADDGVVPTYLAKRFNTEVLAPTETVNVDFEGNMILANDPENAKMGIETGKWVLFGPNGRIE